MKMNLSWKKGKICIVLALMMVVTLMTIGTVYADDGQGAEDPLDAPAAEVSDGGSSSDVSEEDVETLVVETAESPPDGEDQAAEEESGDISQDDPDLPPADETPEQEPGEGDIEEEEEAEEVVEVVEEVEQGEETEEPEDESTAEATAGIGENDITLVDDNGEALDMASESSLEAISGADPWWIVGTLKYVFLKTGGTCPPDAFYCDNTSATPITAALAYMDANNLVPSDGILHIEADSYTENITINGSSGNGYLANLKGLVSDGSSVDTTINGDINVANTLLGFKLSGFTVLGNIDLHNNVGTLTLTDLNVTSTTSAGILVTGHAGKVDVTNVKSNGNKYYGLYLDNSIGTYPVTITNSEFSNNTDSTAITYFAGLWIKTNSTVTLNGVAASNNDGRGADLNAARGTIVKNSVFNNNFADPWVVDSGIGLYILNSFTTNNVVIENVQADGNDTNGILLSTSGKVTLKNVNTYNNGSVSGYDGIMINNGYGVGTVTITNSASRDNGGKGFHILSHNSVIINGITAINNGDDGVYIDNCDFDWGGSLVCLGNGTVKISGKLPNLFNVNGENGLHVLSGSSVTLSYFQADYNTLNGILIETDNTGSSGSVTLNLTYKPPVGDWLNSASHNTLNGINIESFGNISIDKCVVEQNGNFGAYLYNVDALSAKSVSVKNSNFLANNYSGLDIESKGSVILTYVNACDSITGSGVDITNSAGTGTVSISGSKTTNNDISNNFEYGIRVSSGGNVTVKYTLATGNDVGAMIFNVTTEGKSVSISYSDFSDSTGGRGLDILSKGAVTLTNVVSNENAMGGLYISNEGAAKPRTIKITNGQFSDNDSSGLVLYTLGSVILKGVQSSGNEGYGAYIDACRYDGGIPGCKGSGSVSITGTDNRFNSNAMNGLSIYSRAGVTITNIAADSNENSGVFIYHNYDNCSGNVSLSASSKGISSASNNGYGGLIINSYGNISLQRVEINNNVEDGAYLSNQTSPVARNVSVSFATINDNQNDNLVIYSTGAVSLNGVQTLRASKHFWEIDDDNGQIWNDRLPFDQLYDEIWYFEGSNGQSITVDAISVMFNIYLELLDEDWNLLIGDDNSGGGTDAQINYTLGADGLYYLRVRSAGVDGYGDYQLDFAGPSQSTYYALYYGVNIDNKFDDGTGSVTISAPKGSYGLDTRDNNYGGLLLSTNGSIVITGVDASYNGGTWGAQITNSFDAAEGKPVKIKNSSFDNNDGQGINLSSRGTISWSGGGAIGNIENYGANLVNNGSTAYRSISLVNLEFNKNATYGLVVNSLGSIVLKNVGASDNMTWGAMLNNCQDSGGCQGYGNITLSGTYGKMEYNENGSFGLQVSSRGTISLINVNAWDNGSYGASLSNNFSNANGNVVVKSSSSKTLSIFSDNAGDGLAIDSQGTVTLAYLETIDNNGDGVDVDNNFALTAKSVSMKGAITGSNTGWGFFIRSKGAISLSNIIDSGSNTSGGILMDNSTSTDAQKVTLTNVNVDGNTSGAGVNIVSKGDVTLTRVSSNNNYVGAVISNTSGTDAKVTLVSSKGDNTFSGNTNNGLDIASSGLVTLSGVVAEWNGSDGIIVDTNGSLIATNIWLYRNMGTGLDAQADLGATIKNLSAFNNGSAGNGDGLRLVVNSGSLAKIISSVLTGNYGSGIDLSGDPNPLLTGTLYFGNDLNNTGEDNLYIH